MADLEAVLADVSYLMAMEKSKEKVRSAKLNLLFINLSLFFMDLKGERTPEQTSVNSVKNGRRLTLPDRDSANVIKRLLSESGKLDFAMQGSK